MSRRTLRIGVVCYPSLGGSGVVAADLAQGMAQRGHHVHLLATAPPARFEAHNAPVFFNQVLAANYPLFDHAPYAMAMAAKIIEIVDEHPLDILHVHYAVPHAASAFLANQVLAERRPRTITTLHGTDVTGVGQDPSLRSINRFSVEASDSITVPSAFLREAAYTQLGLPRTCPITVIPNFVDTTAFRPADVQDRKRLQAFFAADGLDSPVDDEGTPVVVHVSNFRPVKRVVDVVRVVARVAEHRPIRLLLVGDGPDRMAATQAARELNISQQVSFLGAIPDFASTLKHTDLFLLTSETESFGLAALEALSAGVPVLAYKTGGLAEVIVDGETGLLTKAGDIEAMTRGVLNVLGDPALRLRMAHAARAHVLRHFARDEALDRYEKYYHRVLDAPFKGAR